MRYLFQILFVGLLLSSCSSVRVNYDYDRATDFSSYTTYNYFSDIESGLSALDEKRLVRVLDSTLQSKGYRLDEEPDFYINILSNEFRSASNSAVGVGIGGAGRNVGGGVSMGIPVGNSGIQRMIQFDFVDAQKDALFWQATSESGFRSNASPSVREERLRAVVDKVFSKFPPEKR
ncbi:DUF4136 domain-containing protein [Flagellimonas allohymeniacidonis]|uniref:DUF4136 domain-containing protein n=1 Tax=Flagellimonas allohymeniacidonis TaxID=2517819 RepID=A0A4Q8QN22_9FLAO|nr:DUF4136 domain-containing protein [Allomuricauda hymeniacidonis]TAI49706.1 DUF4136 domain-containing protein [Allomuricauda hymeniacidonis]